MPDYKTMYYTLFNDIVKAINILQNAQKDAEEIFIESDNTPIWLARLDEEKE